MTLFATLARSEAEKVGGRGSSETQAHAAGERLDVSLLLVRSRQINFTFTVVTPFINSTRLDNIIGFRVPESW